MKLGRKRVLSGRAPMLALALIGVAGFHPSAARGQLAVDELEVFLAPGSSPRAGAIVVTNTSDRAIQALVEVQDWDRDEQGANRFYPVGAEAHSCKDRLTVFPLALRIEAGRSETLRVGYTGADTDSCWAIVFVQGGQPQSAGAGSQITYIMRTGVKVYVDRAGATRVGDVDSVAVTEAAPPSDSTGGHAVARQLDVVFKNSGTAHLKTKGTVEIRSAANEVAARLDVLEFPTAPGATRRLSLPLPTSVGPGRYVALVLLDYDGDEIAAGQLQFEVK